MVHVKRARVNAIIGVNMNSTGFVLFGNMISFVSNFIASAIGWRIPERLTMLGPLRACEVPRSFRSISVISAILNIIKIIRRIICIMFIAFIIY